MILAISFSQPCSFLWVVFASAHTYHPAIGSELPFVTPNCVVRLIANLELNLSSILSLLVSSIVFLELLLELLLELP